jgi:ABC-2 type transport system permease protein
MNRGAIATIVWKDLLVVRRSRMMMLPLILVPLILLVVLPGLAALSPGLLPEADLAEILRLIEGAPTGLREDLAGLAPEQQAIVLMLGYLFAPLYLLIPVMVASVIAADSFAGEKERRTLEALLYTPTTDRELVLAKMLGPWLAALAVAWASFVGYAVVVNAAAWPIMGRIFFPTPLWWVLVLWMAPAVAAVALGVSVLVSARVKGFQEAYQLGGLVVLPIVALMIGQMAGAVFLGPLLVFGLGAAVWAVAGFVIVAGARRFRRGEVLARL